jgi:hypothetical protein
MPARPSSLDRFLAAQPAPLAAYLGARLVWVSGDHWLWTGPVSWQSSGGGRGRPKCGITLPAADGPIRFTLVYRLTLYLVAGPALPGLADALHKCVYNNRQIGFCCHPHPRHLVYGPEVENWADRRAALQAAGRRG